MKTIVFFLKYSTGRLVLATVISLLAGASSAMLMALITSRLTGASNSIWTSVWSFSTLVLVVLVTNFISRVVLSRLSQVTLFNMRSTLARLIVASPLRNTENAGIHRVLVALTTDIEQVARVLQAIPVTLIDIAMLLAGFVYLIWLSRPLFVVLIIFVIIAVFTSKIPEMSAGKVVLRARKHWEELVGYFRAVTDGLKELKLHHRRREAFFSGPFQEHLTAHARLRFRAETLYAFAKAWGIVMYFVFVAIVLYLVPKWGGYESKILFGYLLTILYLKTPLDRVQDTLPVYTEGRIALERIEKLGLSLSQIGASLTEAGRKKHLKSLFQVDMTLSPASPGFKKIEMCGVTHKYYKENEERAFELGPIDLTIHAGELIFLVGGNGSGKTTLAKILIGLYEPENGQIFFDDKPILHEDLEWYSQHFAVVFSDFYLFESLFGLETSGSQDLDVRAREYLAKLQLDHKVQVKDGVLSTTKLSQGQRKRLALLTAFLENRPIYLFDEWAADQDPTFKSIFYLEFLPELKARGKTVIIISHDDHYYHIADRIVKLDSGAIESAASIPEAHVVVVVP